MYGSSPLRSIFNPNSITGLDKCEVCGEAVHCSTLNTNSITGLDMSKECEVCTEVVEAL